MRHIEDNGGVLQGRASERSPAPFCCPHCAREITLGGGLTVSQRRVLTFIVCFVAEKQISPSISEINAALDRQSKSGTWLIIDQLCAKGFLAKVGGPYRSRNIVVVNVAGDAR